MNIDEKITGDLIANNVSFVTTVPCKCDSGNIKLPVITMAPVVIRDRFMKAAAS